jgi:hypothetical protein
MESPESSERLVRVVCCAVGAIVGQSAVPLVLLPAEYIRPLLRPAWVFVVLWLVVIVGSWLSDQRGRW